MHIVDIPTCPGAGTLIYTRNHETVIVCTDGHGTWYIYDLAMRFKHLIYASKDKSRYMLGWKQRGHILIDLGWRYATPTIIPRLENLPVWV